MPSVAEVEKLTLRRVALLINLLIVRLRDLPFAVDHIGVHKSNYACGWTTCVQRRQPQTSRFALMSHIQSHADQTGSDFITDIRKNVIYILTPQNLKYIYRIACINRNYMRKDE